MSDSGADDAPPLGSLQRALAYQNDDIVHKFLERYDVPFDEAADIFDETKKWLWLASQEAVPPLAVTHELMLLDEMWHTFILFTRFYRDFCDNYLGKFINHIPTTKTRRDQDERRFREDPEAFRADWNEKMKREMRVVADYLGADTLFKWFVEYPTRYDREFFERATKVAMPMLPTDLLAALKNIADRYQPSGA